MSKIKGNGKISRARKIGRTLDGICEVCGFKPCIPQSHCDCGRKKTYVPSLKEWLCYSDCEIDGGDDNE